MKLYNDKLVKQDIEFRMQKESTKDLAVTHDVSLDNQPNSYKNINIRNGQLIVYTSSLYLDAALCFMILGLFVA